MGQNIFPFFFIFVILRPLAEESSQTGDSRACLFCSPLA